MGAMHAHGSQLHPCLKQHQQQQQQLPALPAPLAKKSNKCNLDGCNDRVVKIVGDCRYCMSKFCTKHRLPEAHACSNIETCRQNSHERLAGKLLKERTVAAKV
ncbi:hypothetical protein BASA62_003200 [Batrachochytrium salamandrivorans]|nr:hypothetical protein BASA62_003200 [Batrachochytrium salamandrivorans]